MAGNNIINIMVHDQKDLFHVSAHKSAKNVGWAKEAKRAKWDYDNLIAGTRNLSNERGMNGGLRIAMVNTNYVGWKDIPYNNYLPVSDPKYVKDTLNLQYEATGKTNVGIRNMTFGMSDSSEPVRWAIPFPTSMPQDKIFQKIDWINISLQLNIPKPVKNDAYRVMALAGGPTLNNLLAQYPLPPNFDIDNMATLLFFVRRAMGLQ